MAPLTPVELLTWLGKEQFIDPAQVAELRPALASYPDARALAKELIRRDWITAYQANQILQGKGEQLLFGPYRLSERLAEGAMGQVFKAWHPRLRRTVALKALHAELVASPKARDRFFREIRLAAQLDHPHIVRALDADEQDGRPYLAMEYVEGTNLAALLKEYGPLEVIDAAEYARQVALGLQHAFERGIVHRDIKPSNLMLAGHRPDDEGRTLLDPSAGGVQTATIKILDFGLARFESEDEEGQGRRLTQVGKILGTVDYIAPEQAADSRTADIRADIYSLGATLYTLLTGEPAFPGDDVMAKLIARQEKDPPGVCALNPEVPIPLESVIKKMMARRPEDRYPTPAEVVFALQPFTPAPTVNLSAETKSLPSMEPGGLVPEELPPLEAGSATGPAFGQAALATAESPDADPFGLEPAATAVARTSAPRSTRSGMPRALVAAAAVLALVVLFGLGWALRGALTPAPPKKGYFNPGAALQIQKAWLSNFDQTLHPGDRKKIIVEVHRVEFDGPVKISVDKSTLPDGVQVQPATIESKKTKGELPITVSFGTDPAKADLKVSAVAENLSAETTLPLTISEAK